MAITQSGFKEFSNWGTKPDAMGAIEVQSVPDTQIQIALDNCTEIIRDMIGLKEGEDLPTSARIEIAVYFLALYFLQNKTTQEVKTMFNPTGEIGFEKTAFYRNLDRQVYARVVQYISKYRKISRFVPSAKEDYATA